METIRGGIPDWERATDTSASTGSSLPGLNGSTQANPTGQTKRLLGGYLLLSNSPLRTARR